MTHDRRATQPDYSHLLTLWTSLPFVIVLLNVIGILMSVRMAIVLGRFSAQNASGNGEPSRAFRQHR